MKRLKEIHDREVALAVSEITVKNSRFIAEVFTVSSQSEARDKLKKQKEKYEDARHVVHAFVIGKNAEILGMSDDGEPSGTAGHPILDVLKGSEITNVLLTVTRYFGGTLLGTGGLVKAYSGAAKSVLEIAQTEPLIEKIKFNFSVSYTVYEKVKRLLETLNASDITETFETDIAISGLIPANVSNELSNQIFDITKGSVSVRLTQ
ncbi:MAG: YigZ family protein [Treponema sp. CETP13]|nr:MAG: YigZ family protein [Treponema sp. CETP13]